MKFKDIYNPREVYEGFFESYFIRPFFHHYADFSGMESVESLGKSLLAWLVITLGIAGIMLGQIGFIGPESGFSLFWIVIGVWGALSLIPLVALSVRATHGAPSKPIRGRMLGVDTLLGVSCLLFFLLGLLMMVTTMNSGELNPNARVYDEEDTVKTEEEYYIKEEPIFTYQDEAEAASVSDSMSDMTEPDLATQEESFDPTIEAIYDSISN